jgi:hypothetical protein
MDPERVDASGESIGIGFVISHCLLVLALEPMAELAEKLSILCIGSAAHEHRDDVVELKQVSMATAHALSRVAFGDFPSCCTGEVVPATGLQERAVFQIGGMAGPLSRAWVRDVIAEIPGGTLASVTLLDSDGRAASARAKVSALMLRYPLIEFRLPSRRMHSHVVAMDELRYAFPPMGPTNRDCSSAATRAARWLNGGQVAELKIRVRGSHSSSPCSGQLGF